MTEPIGDRMRDNLATYRHHQMAAGALFWLPAVMLHLIDRVGLADALRLQAVYYVAVVVFEVPSGWWSDRFGRVVTMRAAAIAWIGAHTLFVTSSSIVALVVAQILLALGYACLSGTDSTLHLDSLEAVGRADEFAEREATIRRHTLIVMAAAVLTGGALGVVDMRLVFAASLAAATVQLAIASRLVEPPTAVDDDDRSAHGSIGTDARALASALRVRVVGWLALCIVVQITVVHLAADLTPPYLASLVGDQPSSGALAAGIVAALVAGSGALTVGLVPRIARRHGVPATLLAAGAVPVAILVAMAAVEAWWLTPLLVFRGVQSAAVSVLAPQVVAAHAPARRRATLLSVMSLGGRLAYGAALLALGASADDTGGALRIAAAVALGAWLLVAVLHRVVPRSQRELTHEHHHVHEPIVHDHAHRHDDGHHDHEHVGHHHPELDLSDGPVFHAHPHRHERLEHRHAHTTDAHHRHDH